ncbi:MAG TPA: HEAT repeat domain-containing protein [Polyangia bacterium]|nr:HEAT repeat domain-containing protein [Polyangia bacterium]
MALFLAMAIAWSTPARADKVDDLTRALMQDSSYKVRVQAALVLGKLNDRRAVPALIQALHDENETVRGVAATSLGRMNDKSAANALMQSATNDSSDFVKTQAKKALELIAGGGPSLAPQPRAGARFYIAIEILGRAEPQSVRMVKEALQRELQKLPTVTLSVAGGGPSKSLLSARNLSGFMIDINIQQLAATPAAGGQQIDCGLKAVVATFPDKSIKMITQEGASLTVGSGPSEAESGKRDCVGAAVEAVRDDVAKFLRTQE